MTESARATTAEQTAWALAEAFDAYSCPRGCGELIHRSRFPDEPESLWEIPFGSNETRRHTRERCDDGRSVFMLARVYSSARPDEFVWDRSLRFTLSTGHGEDVRGLGSPDTYRLPLRTRQQVVVTDGRLLTWRSLLASRQVTATYREPAAPQALLTIEAWPVVDEHRWCHTTLGRLALADIDHDPVDGYAATYDLLETLSGWTYQQAIVTEVPDAPPWWALT